MPENPTLYDRTVCSCIIDTAPLIEAELRKIGAIKRDLSGLITQGAYSTSVSASAGTHAGGGVIDVRYSLTDTDAKRRAWAAGAAIAFPRTRILGLWPSHGHVVWRGCPHLAASAARQVTSYLDGRNGLKSNAPLGYPAVPVPTVQQILAPKPAPKPPAPKPAPPSRPRVSLADVQTQARRRRRSVSEHVRTVQRALLAENIRTVGPADGWWGPRTTEAYAYWQHWLGYRGRAADGIPGRVTLARLGQRQGFDVVLAPKPAPKPPAPKPAPPSRPRVSLADVQTQARRRRRSVSEHVRTVQRALLAENIRTVGPADGWWGPRTTEAYAYWQHWLGYRGRAADGIPGRVTLARLGQRQGFDVVS